jgi:hypothetical protein
MRSLRSYRNTFLFSDLLVVVLVDLHERNLSMADFEHAGDSKVMEVGVVAVTGAISQLIPLYIAVAHFTFACRYSHRWERTRLT